MKKCSDIMDDGIDEDKIFSNILHHKVLLYIYCLIFTNKIQKQKPYTKLTPDGLKIEM